MGRNDLRRGGSAVDAGLGPRRGLGRRGWIRRGTEGRQAAYCVENASGAWQQHYLENPPGVPLAGELRAIDHQGRAIGGGYVGDLVSGTPVAVELRTDTWVYLETELRLPSGTLFAMGGVDVDDRTSVVAFAVEGVDFSGCDVTAQLPAPVPDPDPVPGPGIWLGLALLCAGYRAGRLRA